MPLSDRDQSQQPRDVGRCLPERRLAAALLESALADLVSDYDDERRRAILWIEAAHVGRVTFSESCAFLGLDAVEVRKMARRVHSSKVRR
jgi:hypothetical protein